MKPKNDLEKKVSMIVSNAKRRLQNMDWRKRYNSYLDALFCECAKDTLKIIERQQKEKSRHAMNKPPPST